jgi:hypothetical protein
LGNVWRTKMGLDFKSLIRDKKRGRGRKWEIVEYGGNKKSGLETEPFANAIHIFRQINNAFPEKSYQHDRLSRQKNLLTIQEKHINMSFCHPIGFLKNFSYIIVNCAPTFSP